MKLVVYMLLVLVARLESDFEFSYVLKPESETEQGQSLKSKKEQDLFVYNEQNIQDLLFYNNDNLLNRPTEQNSFKMIEKYGKKSILTQSKSNYLFIIESDTLGNVEDRNSGSIIRTNICQNQQKYCLLSKILKQDRERNYFYSSNSFGSQNSYEDFLVRLENNNKNGSLVLKDTLSQQQLVIGQSLQQCANQMLDRFKFDLEKQKVFEYDSSNLIGIKNENRKAIEGLMEDICSISQLSYLIMNNNQQDSQSYIFWITSLKDLEQYLDFDQRAILYDLWNEVIKRFQERVQGIGLLVHQHPIDNYEKQQKSKLLSEMRFKSKSRMLFELRDSTMDGPHHQIYIWLPLVLAFILFQSFMMMVNMDLHRDTLLYAKFIHTDTR